MKSKVTSGIARWSSLLFLPRFGCRRSLLSEKKPLLNTIVVLFLCLVSPLNYANALEISSNTPVATAGYFQLQWKGNNQALLLQESSTEDFKSFNNIYKGKDLARVMSGKSDGDYFYRVVDPENQSRVSNLVKISVKHHPLENAFLFFIAGAIVFIATLVLIVRGNKEKVN